MNINYAVVSGSPFYKSISIYRISAKLLQNIISVSRN